MNIYVNPYFQNLAPIVRFLQTWTKTSVKCYCTFLTTSLGINWCPASEALIQCLCLFKWPGRVQVSCGLCDREPGLSEERLALTTMPKIRHYFSFKAFWNSYYQPIKTLISVLALPKQSPCNFFKHCHEKHGTGSVGTSTVSPSIDATTQTSFSLCANENTNSCDLHTTNKMSPSVKTSCGKGEKDQEKHNLQTSRLVMLPEWNHARSREMAD